MADAAPRALALPAWPNGADVAVSLTFDVDGESAWLGRGAEYESRLSTLSEARFGIVRGLPRILALLRDLRIPATFYVPGDTAERHPDAIRAVADAGHEVGHHGYLHLRPDQIDEARQREEVDRGIAALEACVGRRPLGYRSPAWELTPATLAHVVARGFRWDSSCMGDDRPYVERHGDATILELPVHWSLDDYPHFGFSLHDGGRLSGTAPVLDAWVAELEVALRERRHVTYTMHPEVIGRGYRTEMLREFVEAISARANVWFATHAEVADVLSAAGEGAAR
jgi:peptidoglycan/xylan/chitin deacetylase (PgdA/CDA1 family)